MVEKTIKDYLQTSLGIPVRLEEEDNLGNEYVLIEKTGSGAEGDASHPVLFYVPLWGSRAQ